MINFRFFCGNSSAVEHDLAKVGVASSNLVSRSILLFLLITTLSFASQKDIISKAVLVEFKKQYPCLDADMPVISSTSPLSADFNKYKFIKIELRDNQLRKSKGSFRAILKTENREKNIHLRFEIDAYVYVFKAKHKLYNDKILHSSDYEKVLVKLDKLPSKVITCTMPEKLITKSYIREGSILTMNRFKHKKDVLRGTDIRAFIKDGVLVLDIKATLLKDTNVGDIAKIKTDKGKIFRAKLVSKNRAIILD